MQLYNQYDNLIFKYKSNGVVIDSNLLLLFFIGCFDKNLILKFKRTSIYTIDDFELLCNFIGFFDKIIVTPHILTEVSNLSNQLNDKIKRKYFEKFLDLLKLLIEKQEKALIILDDSNLRHFGITDSGISHHAKEGYLVITDDFRLASILESNGIDVINFNHLRMSKLLLE